MHCPALSRGVTSAECCEYILSRSSGAEYAVCRQCPIGLGMMATVKAEKEAKVTNYYDPAAPVTTETVMTTEATKTISGTAMAKLAGISQGRVSYITRQWSEGKEVDTESAYILKKAMKNHGYGWDITRHAFVASDGGAETGPIGESAEELVAVVAMMEPEAAPEPVAVVSLPVDGDQCTEADSAAVKMVAELQDLSDVSADDMLYELRRRYHNVTVTITL